MARFEVRSWVCDWGVWYIPGGYFVGPVFDFYNDALFAAERANQLDSLQEAFYYLDGNGGANA